MPHYRRFFAKNPAWDPARSTLTFEGEEIDFFFYCRHEPPYYYFKQVVGYDPISHDLITNGARARPVPLATRRAPHATPSPRADRVFTTGTIVCGKESAPKTDLADPWCDPYVRASMRISASELTKKYTACDTAMFENTTGAFGVAAFAPLADGKK